MESLGPLVRAEAVEALEAFKVRIRFSNGVEKIIDLEPYLHGPIFESIRKNPSVFQTVKVIGNTIGWENGADIDPDVLYYDLKPAWLDETEVKS